MQNLTLEEREKFLQRMKNDFEIYYDHSTCCEHMFIRKIERGNNIVALLDSLYPATPFEVAIKIAAEKKIRFDYVGVVTDEEIATATFLRNVLNDMVGIPAEDD